MEYRASVHVAAPIAQLWSVVTDVATWQDWDPNVEHVSGQVVLGGTVTVQTTLSPRSFPVTVSELDAPRRMVWSSGMPLGMFRGARTFTFDEQDGGTTYTVHEVFSGLLLPIMRRTMPDLQPSFEAHVAGLKTHLEGA